MKKFRFGLTLVIAAVLFSAVMIWAAPQKTCPVMGGDIDKQYFTDYKGYRIYFCCADCPDDFKKNPEKYMKKLKKEGVDLEKTPSTKTKHDSKGHDHKSHSN